MDSMKIALFLGPSLDTQAAQSCLPGAALHGPAECGSIYRAARDGADAIGLIDGYFDQRLSVWHKEILWALSRGVRVVGGASLGALRACELAPFGMVGVGKVFEWFASGSLEDDDEVCVAHKPAEEGYVAVSDALVNIRATLLAARNANVITEKGLKHFVGLAKDTFYPERSFRKLFRDAMQNGSFEAECTKLREFVLGQNQIVDQKREDALLVLKHLGSEGRKPEFADFQFEHTEAWHEFLQRTESRQVPTP